MATRKPFPFPAHLSKHVRRKFGDDVGGDLVTWLEEMRADREYLLTEIRASEERLARRMDERFAKVDERFAKVDAGFDRVDKELASLRVAIADSKADLMKWNLVFWVGAVGAIAGLAGVFRQ